MNHEHETSAEEVALRAAELNEAFRLFVAEDGWAATQAHFRAHYRGTWQSLDDYGRHLVHELQLDSDFLESVPDWLMPYVRFDYVSFGMHDLQRDCRIIQGRTGMHVFDRYADPTPPPAVEYTTSDAGVHRVA
jgi:hypothetical protein